MRSFRSREIWMGFVVNPSARARTRGRDLLRRVFVACWKEDGVETCRLDNFHGSKRALNMSRMMLTVFVCYFHPRPEHSRNGLVRAQNWTSLAIASLSAPCTRLPQTSHAPKRSDSSPKTPSSHLGPQSRQSG